MQLNILKLVWLIGVFMSCQNSNAPEHHVFFNKIVGEWKLEDKTVIEKWNYADGTYMGSVFVVSGNDNVITEEIRIIENNKGVFYEAKVNDQNQGESIYFKLILTEDNKVIFENKEHDFPQQITYKLTDTNSLVATIQGIINEESKSIKFNYSRIQKNSYHDNN